LVRRHAYCKWAGKRLCGRTGGGALAASERTDPAKSQLLLACSHEGKQNFPYGPTYVAGKCNIANGASGVGPPTTTCAGAYPGIVDLVGNAWEWYDGCAHGVDEPSAGFKDYCPIFGGNYAQTSDYDCYIAVGAQRNFSGNGTGFRCCGP
jgi:sulfatase modifying factor 1